MDFMFLSHTVLFRGTTPEEVERMVACLGAVERQFDKGEVLCHAGDSVESLGLVLSGGVNIESHDSWGNTSILSHVAPGQIFAETYACLPGEPLMVDVVAAAHTDVLFLNTVRVLQTCPDTCAHHAKLIRNLLFVLAQKNLNLSRRIFHTSPKTIRGRLLSYLSFQAIRQGSSRFTIPFNRQQLADYLDVDRSALSKELGKMRNEGLLTFTKNKFDLKEPATDV